jgi:hypothetical protein
MELVKAKCNVCGKEIVGLSQKHVDHLMRVHKYTVHLLQNEISNEDKELLNLIKSLPKPIIEALNNENKRKLILDVLEGRVKTFKYLSQNPSWEVILRMGEKMGYNKDELISEALEDWFFEAEEFQKRG